MQMSTSASIEIARPREAVFDLSCACETFTKLFGSRGPVAGISVARMMDGQPLRTGARRHIEMSDGAILMEDIVAYERPSRHRYRWTQGLRPPAKFLVSAGEAEWIYGARRFDAHRLELHLRPD